MQYLEVECKMGEGLFCELREAMLFYLCGSYTILFNDIHKINVCTASGVLAYQL